MGKWSSGKRRGKAGDFGVFAAPVDLDWAPLSEASQTLTIERLRSIPAGADGMALQCTSSEDGSVTSSAPTAASNISCTGLTNGVEYAERTAWFAGTRRVSPWSSPQLDTPS
jgi:hypothetical protein